MRVSLAKLGFVSPLNELPAALADDLHMIAQAIDVETRPKTKPKGRK